VKFGGSILSRLEAGKSAKTGPALIVSNDVANANLKRLQVVPLTSNSGRLYPSGSEVIVAGQVSKAMADQLATVAKERLGNSLACSAETI
jgi:mRNA interferase MazF